MSDKPHVLLPLIPFLRRHARLLAGSQEVGDEYVRLTLEKEAADTEWREGADLRCQLFRAFHRVCGALEKAVEPAPEAVTVEQRMEYGLATLAPVERKVLLLAEVENFGYEEIGQILELDIEAVRSHLVQARENLHQQVTKRVLIIEDEPMIAMELRRLVQEMGLNVAHIVAHEKDAVLSVEEDQPGLVLADIQLQDESSGVAAASAILEKYNIPIVFVTGYPERLLTGSGLEPAFVLAKPFSEAGLKATIAQALDAYASPARAGAHRAKLLAKLRELTGTTIPEGGSV